MEGPGTMLESRTTTRACDRRRIRLAAAVFTSAGLLVVGSPAVGVDYEATSRISVSTGGDQTQPDPVQESAYSGGAHISADGRYVAFYSYATNLVSDDTNNRVDVFVRELASGTTERVSVSSNGAQGNGDSLAWPLAISGHGRFVAFTSEASTLVSGDTNGASDVFVRDRRTGTTERVSVTSSESQGAHGTGVRVAMSPRGRYVGFSYFSPLAPGDTNSFNDVFVRDRLAGTTQRISNRVDGRAAGGEVDAITAGGRLVFFSSSSPRVVAGDTNRATDVFVHNRETDTTRRVSLSSRGCQGNDASLWASASADGRYVVFASPATNMVRTDTNSRWDVFVRDRDTRTTRRVSVSTRGDEANRDSWEDSSGPKISNDGRYVTFESRATNLVPADTNARLDVFVRDVVARTTQRVNVNSSGDQAGRNSYSGDVSADGQVVVFESFAGNLVPGDTNGTGDIFMRSSTAP
jgi:hypothetical protein